MIVQNFDLNLIPDSAPVVVHVDQYDHGTGRFRISLYEGDVSYEPSGTAQIQGKKPDGRGFLYNASLSGNVVTANLEEQMTAVAGKVLAQVIVTETSGRTGSFKFILDVQASALPDDTDMSESDYQAIEELIEEAQEVAQEVAEDKTAAENAATSAGNSAEDSEAWAKGTRDGQEVPPTDPTYQQNSRYWAGQAEQYAQGGLKFVSTIFFASLPTSGMRAGDMYNIKDAFTTDSRFEEGAGIRYPEGTNVAWTPNNKWDVLAGNIRVLVSITLAQFNALTNDQKNDPTIWWWVPDANNGTMGGSVSSVTAYPELTDKPSINGVEINGAMTSSMLHLAGELPEIMPISKGGTGNNAGYIQTGRKANTSIGNQATAEGSSVTASGLQSHGEGFNTTASGWQSHAEGFQTTASGQGSHAGGYVTIAANEWQTAIGKCNDNKSDTLFEVGNGRSGLNRSNAFEVYSDGHINVNGDLDYMYHHMRIGEEIFDSGNGDMTLDQSSYTFTDSSWTYFTLTLTKAKLQALVNAGKVLVAIKCFRIFNASTGSDSTSYVLVKEPGMTYNWNGSEYTGMTFFGRIKLKSDMSSITCNRIAINLVSFPAIFFDNTYRERAVYDLFAYFNGQLVDPDR